MSCCIGIAGLPWNKNQRNDPEDGYYVKLQTKCGQEETRLLHEDESKISLNAESCRVDSASVDSSPDIMSSSTAVRVPPLPTSSKVFRGMKGHKRSKEEDMIITDQYLVNGQYFCRKDLPSSSSDTTDSNHYKASSSDSSYSKDESADVPGEIKFRQSQIPAMTCFNFDATNQDEISFKRGSKVYVRQSHACDDQYVYIEFDDGKGGYAPKQFLQPVGKVPPIISQSDVDRRTGFIGEGTFAKVYVAYYKSVKYALKEYKNPSFEKAIKEAECLNAMDHVNIVKAVALCKEPVFMLMEFCEDQLVNLLRRPFFNPPLRVVMNWALQIAEGLWHMHNREIPICHSDIKPSNIMIMEKPCICKNSYQHEESDNCKLCGNTRLSRLTLKLTDFGLARPDSSGNVNARRDEELVGSAPYMAPEYIREMKMTPKADVWSFGVLFWELLTKEIPYGDTEAEDRFTILWGIGKGFASLQIPDNCPPSQARLLNLCWKANDVERPTMKEVIELIKDMPTTDPEYVIVCGTKQQSTTSLIGQLKLKMQQMTNMTFSEGPSPPKRKNKGVSKLDISNPTDFRTLLSVHHDENDRYTIRDLDEDRQRHKSSHDYSEQGTLPRTGYGSNKKKINNTYSSTPDLNAEIDGTKLERANAVRRKQAGSRNESVSAMLRTSESTSTVLGTGPVSASTPTELAFDLGHTIQVVDDCELVNVPVQKHKTSRDSQKELSKKCSPKRSPSSNSNSTFYVSSNGEFISTPTYDTSTIKSESSIESGASTTTSKKSRGLLSFFKAKSQDHSVCYDSLSKKYHNLREPRPSISDDSDVAILAKTEHMKPIPLSQFNQDTAPAIAPRFTKLQDSAMNQRKKAAFEIHRRNRSNASEKIVLTESERRTPPPFHHTSSENGLTPPTPKHLGPGSWAGPVSPSKSIISMVIPFTTSPTTPEEFRIRTKSSFDLRTNATTLTTEFPVDERPLTPVLHARSKSSETHAKENSKMLDSLAKRFKEQTIVENHGYFKMKPGDTKPVKIDAASSPEPQHYRALKTTAVPALPPRAGSRRISENDPPPRPPPRHSISNSSLNTVIELPKSIPPPVPARSQYLSTPERTESAGQLGTYMSPHSSVSTPTSAGSPDEDYNLPSSTAPTLIRPDTLSLDVGGKHGGIQRNGNRYLKLAPNVKNSSDQYRVPHIPNDIKQKSKR